MENLRLKSCMTVTGVVAQVVDCLPSKHKALIQTPVRPKKELQDGPTMETISVTFSLSLHLSSAKWELKILSVVSVVVPACNLSMGEAEAGGSQV
jgi:hypothetical protein